MAGCAPSGDTWSIIVTLPNDLSCGFASGTMWAAVPKGEAL